MNKRKNWNNSSASHPTLGPLTNNSLIDWLIDWRKKSKSNNKEMKWKRKKSKEGDDVLVEHERAKSQSIKSTTRNRTSSKFIVSTEQVPTNKQIWQWIKTQDEIINNRTNKRKTNLPNQNKTIGNRTKESNQCQRSASKTSKSIESTRIEHDKSIN